MDDSKKGVFTTEFWLVLAALIGSLLFVFQGSVEWSSWIEFAKWVVITYLASRTVVKGIDRYKNGG